jgi:hypothetical protein
MLVQVKFLLKTSTTYATNKREIYDVPKVMDAYKNICDRYGEDQILKPEFKILDEEGKSSTEEIH